MGDEYDERATVSRHKAALYISAGRPSSTAISFTRRMCFVARSLAVFAPPVHLSPPFLWRFDCWFHTSILGAGLRYGCSAVQQRMLWVRGLPRARRICASFTAQVTFTQAPSEQASEVHAQAALHLPKLKSRPENSIEPRPSVAFLG